MFAELPRSLQPRCAEMPESFARAIEGSFDDLGEGTLFILPGGSKALIFPQMDDELARAESLYRAAIIDMNEGQYPEDGSVGKNEGRNMAFFCHEGQFVITVNGKDRHLEKGGAIATRDGDSVKFSGTGKLFVLADGGETNEYPDGILVK